MTILKQPIRRELPVTFDRRQWMVALHPWGLEFRAKRTRRPYTITWESILNRTMQIAAEQIRRERIEARRAKGRN